MLYRRRPKTVNALRYTKLNRSEVKAFLGSCFMEESVNGLLIHTLDGVRLCREGDYVVQDGHAFVLMSDDAFNAEYAPA